MARMIFQYKTEDEHGEIFVRNAENQFVSESNLASGNFIEFEDLSQERCTKQLEDQGRWRGTLMINQIVVRIVAKRILGSGINPKTGEVYMLDDITNIDYRQAVEDYILTNTEGI